MLALQKDAVNESICLARITCNTVFGQLLHLSASDLHFQWDKRRAPQWQHSRVQGLQQRRHLLLTHVARATIEGSQNVHCKCKRIGMLPHVLLSFYAYDTCSSSLFMLLSRAKP